MKLHKLLVGGGMILALSAALFLGSCSNNSKGSEGDGGQQGGQQDGGDQGGQQGGDQGGQETTVTLTADKFQGDGDICKVTVDGEKLIIEHTERVANWEGFRMKETEDLGTSMSLKVTNLGADKAWVKVLVKKVEDGNDVDQITHYKIGNGEKKAMPFDKDNADGVPFTLEKTGDSQTITVWYTDSAAKLVVLVDCNPWAFGGSNGEDVDKKPKAGKIEISELKFTTASASTEEGEQGGEAGEQGEEGGEQGGQQDGGEEASVAYEYCKKLGSWTGNQLKDMADATYKNADIVAATELTDLDVDKHAIFARITFSDEGGRVCTGYYYQAGINIASNAEGYYYITNEFKVTCLDETHALFSDIVITNDKIGEVETPLAAIKEHGLRLSLGDGWDALKDEDKVEVWVIAKDKALGQPTTLEPFCNTKKDKISKIPVFPASLFAEIGEGKAIELTFTPDNCCFSYEGGDYYWVNLTDAEKAAKKTVISNEAAIGFIKTNGIYVVSWGDGKQTIAATIVDAPTP